jgi:vancomycin resistance protein YoaR
MKRIIYFPLIFSFFIFMSISCKTKNPSVDESHNNPSVNTPINNNTGTAQSVPEVTVPPEPTAESKAPEPQVEQEQTPIVNNVEPPKEVKPKRTPIGNCKTQLLNKTKNRVSNISLAAKKINGCKVKSGAKFSFNDRVGKRDAQNGFKVATVIVKGEYSEDMGGGVCQLSSTLFNAVDRAKLEVLERHAHSKGVAYLPPGRDAAVSYGYLDFKFKNNKDYTIEIKAWVENNQVHVSIYKAK